MERETESDRKGKRERRGDEAREREYRQRGEQAARLSRSDATGAFRSEVWREGIARWAGMRHSPHPLAGFGGFGGVSGSGVLVGAQWVQVGPSPLRTTLSSGPVALAGRVYDVAIDPSGSTDQTIYIATLGGIWKSVDGGTTWKPKTDRLPWTQMSAVALDPANPSIVYAGGIFGPGPSLFRSIDGGETWAAIGGSAMQGQLVVRIVVPSSNVVLVQTFIYGLFRSVDGGTSFGNNSPFYNNNAAILGGIGRDLHRDTATATTAYACASGGIFKSTDSGATFPTNLFANPGAPTAGTYDCVTMAQSTTPDNQTLYASVSSVSTGAYVGFYKSTNGGGNWTIQPGAAPAAAGGQFGFDQTVGVDPQDASRVYIGFQDLHLSTDGGATFPTNVTAGKIHSDHHAIAFSPSSHWGAPPTRLYVGEDGGFAASGNGGTTWSNLDEGVATILVGAGSLDIGRGSAANNAYSYAGSQDNGIAGRAPGLPGTDWKFLGGGDGGALAVAHDDPTRVYATQNFSYLTSSTAGASWTGATGLPSYVFVVAVDPQDGSRVYACGGPTKGGGPSLYQSTDHGASFAAMHTFPSTIDVIAVSPRSANVVWVGLNDGTAWRTDNALAGGGSTWTSYSTGLPSGRGISSIAIDPSSPSRVVLGYTGVSGIPAPSRSQHVYLTTTSGTSWVDASGTDGGPVATNLPDRPVFSVAIDPGSSNGLFGITWSGSQLVAVGLFGTAMTSLDGVTWTEQASDAYDTLADVAWTGSKLIACGLGGTILTSPDGAAWTSRKTGPSWEALQGVAWSGSIAVVTSASNGTVYTSPDGTTWTQHTGAVPQALLGVTWGGGKFVAVGYAGTIVTSLDGITWTTHASSTTDDLVSVVWSGSLYVATGVHGTIVTSTNGTSWTTRTSPTTNEINDVAWSGSAFCGVVNTGEVVTSPDGITWTIHASSTGKRMIALTWMGSQFVAVGDLGTIMTSPDGTAWTDRSVGGDPFALIAGNDTGVLRSIDSGATWQILGVGLPHTQCMSLALDTSRDPSLLRVGTNGRSVFELQTVDGPRIAVLSNLGFGKVAVASTGGLTVQAFNVGSAPLTISSFVRTSGSTAFNLAPGVTFPVTLPPGGELDLTVTFQPASAGNATAVFSLTSSDPSSPTLTVPASGVGV